MDPHLYQLPDQMERCAEFEGAKLADDLARMVHQFIGEEQKLLNFAASKFEDYLRGLAQQLRQNGTSAADANLFTETFRAAFNSRLAEAVLGCPAAGRA